jgi:hypothetical protein
MKVLDMKTMMNSIVIIDHHLKNDMVSMTKIITIFVQNFIEICWNLHQPLRHNIFKMIKGALS